MKTFAILLLTVVSFSSVNADPGNIKVKVKNIRSKAGHILVSLYNNASQFPRKPFKVIKLNKKDLKNGVVEAEITDLPNGQYAISLLDDENNNEDMDYSWIGTPVEGYSFSNGAQPKLLSAPDYEDAVFYSGDKPKEIELTITYW